MKRILFCGALGLLISLAAAPHAWAFGWKDVVQMTKDGVSDDLIIEKIDHSGKSFNLNADDIHDLKEAGVSDNVISAMLKTEDQEDDNYAYYPPTYYGPYYAPYYYPRFGSRIFVDLNLGHRGYYGHRGGYIYRGYGGGYRGDHGVYRRGGESRGGGVYRGGSGVYRGGNGSGGGGGYRGGNGGHHR